MGEIQGGLVQRRLVDRIFAGFDHRFVHHKFSISICLFSSGLFRREQLAVQILGYSDQIIPHSILAGCLPGFWSLYFIGGNSGWMVNEVEKKRLRILILNC